MKISPDDMPYNPPIYQVSASWGAHFAVAYSSVEADAKRQVVKKLNKTLRFWYSDPPKIRAHQVTFTVKELYELHGEANRDMPRTEVPCRPGAHAALSDGDDPMWPL